MMKTHAVLTLMLMLHDFTLAPYGFTGYFPLAFHCPFQRKQTYQKKQKTKNKNSMTSSLTDPKRLLILSYARFSLNSRSANRHTKAPTPLVSTENKKKKGYRKRRLTEKHTLEKGLGVFMQAGLLGSVEKRIYASTRCANPFLPTDIPQAD